MENHSNQTIELEYGSGGKKSWELIKEIRQILKFKGKWQNTGDDAATFDPSTSLRAGPSTSLRAGPSTSLRAGPSTSLRAGPSTLLPASQKRFAMANRTDSSTLFRANHSTLFKTNFSILSKVKFDTKLVFTTDSFIVDPIFFPGGDIGKISICGTINDLAIMGAKPIGISLAIIIEEGFPKKDLMKIISSINKVSIETGIPIVTGDTKVIEKGKLDKIEITTAGIGLAKKIIPNNGAKPGDFIISSADLGEHTVAILSKRFNYKTKIKSDSKPLNKELEVAGKYLNACKDPTRGGLSANIVEIAEKSKVRIILDEKLLPFKKETISLGELLGIDIFSFASEGRFIASVSSENINKVLNILKKFNREAKIIGRAEKGKGVFLKTKLGSLRKIDMPIGKLIPRIC